MRTNIYFLTFLISILLFLSCNSKKENSPIEIKGKTQTELLQSLKVVDSLYDLKIIDIPIMSKFVENSKQFAADYPEEKLTPTYLFKAGVLSMEMANYAEDKETIVKHAQEALSIFSNIQKIYPDFENVNLCLYNRGVIFDVILNDYNSAEIEYRDYIHKYPKDSNTIWLKEYVDKHLGKTPDELFQDINKKK
jgi:hypothetical protein